MALSDPTDFYETVDNFKTLTQQSTLTGALTDDQVKALLLETMTVIDGYVGRGWTPFTEGQEFIFPRSIDEDSSGSSFIPRSVTLATRMIADAILVKRSKGVTPDELVSETDIGYSYTKASQNGNIDPLYSWIPKDALALLAECRRVGGYLALDESDEF